MLMRLYTRNTWHATDRLQDLRQGGTEKLELEDVIELYQVFCQGCQEYDTMPTLDDFGAWLSATGMYLGQKQAEVIW